MTDQPEGHEPRGYERLAQDDADRRGLSREEYGVYKGSVGSVVKPINTAGGLLALCIAATAIAVVDLTFVILILAQSAGFLPVSPNSTELSPVTWIFIIGYFPLTLWAWAYYFKEKKAQKLRIERGLPRNLT